MAEPHPFLERAHRIALGGLALLLGLVEGPAQIALAVTLATTIATGRLRGYRPGRIELAVLLWVVVGYLGLIETTTPRISSAGALAPLHVLAVPVGARALRGLKLRPYVVLALAGIGVNAAFGVLQVFVYDLPIEKLITGRTLPHSLRDPEAPHRLTMARGLFYNRLKLAHVGVIGLGLAVLVALRRVGRDRRGAVLVALVIGAGVLLTFRRAAPLALAVGFGGLLFVRGNRRAVLGIALGAGLLLGGLSLSGVGQRRAANFSRDVQARLRLFSLGVEIWRENPLFGVGHGDYEGVAEPRLPKTGRWGLQSSSPHNQALDVLAETGLLGALGFFLALGGALWRLAGRLRKVWDFVDAQAMLTLLTLTALGAVHTVLHHPTVAILWWLSIGVAASNSGRVGPRGPGASGASS